MSIPSGPIPAFAGGPALTDQNLLQKLAQLIGSVDNSVVAKSGGNQANATVVNGVKVKIKTCAADNDSVKLPPGYPGLEIVIYNPTAHSVQVYGSGIDTINAVATATGVAQATLKSAIYTCYDVVAGVALWGRVLSA